MSPSATVSPSETRTFQTFATISARTSTTANSLTVTLDVHARSGPRGPRPHAPVPRARRTARARADQALIRDTSPVS
ncbi:hypothetical protein GCM10010466_56230 [Planomonospora alba]|uniref:Uncharacterized protein n=1 Tax=Planomonospora alba TaxID=161354 RepID=A0ABP6NU91_9ACTN